MTERFERARAFLAGPRARLVAVVAAVVVALPSMATGLQLDDWWHRIYLTHAPRWAPAEMPPLQLFTFYDGDPARGRWLMDQGIAAWWSDPHLRISFLRPLSAVTHWIDYALWPDVPALMHVQSIAWYALCVAVAASLYRRVIGAGWVAGLAALMYAVDHTHATPAAWIANRNGAVAASLALAALALHDRARRDGRRGAGVASLVLLALALLSGEASVAVVGFLFAYALCLDAAGWRRGLRALAPHAALLLGWIVLYRVGRFGVNGSGMYVDPVGAPLAFLKMAAVGMPLLLGAELGAPTPDVFAIAPMGVQLALVVIALAVLALASAALVPILRRSAAARFFALGAVIAVVPSCLTVPSARTLLVPGFGLIGLVALAVEAALDAVRRPRALTIFAAWAGGAHLLLSPLIFQIGTAEVPMLGGKFERLAASLPDDPALSRRKLVVANAPDGAFAGYVSVLRWAHGRSVPASLLSLAVGTRDVDLTRTGARTLRVRSRGGFVRGGTELLTRDPRHALPVGTHVALDGVAVDVVEATDDGRPAVVRFTFERPLEDPALDWVAWRGDRLVPLPLPAVGGSVHFAAQSLLP